MMKRLVFMLFAAGVFCAAPVGAQTSTGGETELTGAVIKEQDVTFAVVVVKDVILNDKTLADELITTLEPTFGNIPVVLMVQDAQGTPSYYGRPDIAAFLAKVPFESIQWKKYSLKESGR